ncbi:MAG: phosphorylase [Candidatus Korobacteraceae bacterium]|jgi:adenosylhomocysteine nucleosidase
MREAVASSQFSVDGIVDRSTQESSPVGVVQAHSRGHKPVAIVAAMPMELTPLLGKIRPRQVNGICLVDLDRAVVAVGGMGEKCARHAAETAIGDAQPALLLSAGFAGAISPGLKVGDVARIREVVDAATGRRYPTNGGEWVLATSQDVSNAAEKRELLMKFGADAVDMEAAAVAQVASEQGLKFAAIKAISDDAGFVMPPLAQFIDKNGRFHKGRFLLYVAFRPKWWPTLAKMRTNSAIASANLCRAVKHLLVDSGQ